MSERGSELEVVLVSALQISSPSPPVAALVVPPLDGPGPAPAAPAAPAPAPTPRAPARRRATAGADGGFSAGGACWGLLLFANGDLVVLQVRAPLAPSPLLPPPALRHPWCRARSVPPPSPSPCTKRTRLVLPPVLSGHVSSFPLYRAAR